MDFGDGEAVGTEFFYRITVDAGGFAGDHHIVAHTECFGGLELDLGDIDAAEVVFHQPEVDLVLGSLGAVAFAPLAEFPTQVVAVPEPSVEDGSEPLHPAVDFLFGIGAVLDGFDSLAVAFGDGAHVVGTPPPPFYL